MAGWAGKEDLVMKGQKVLPCEHEATSCVALFKGKSNILMVVEEEWLPLRPRVLRSLFFRILVFF